MINQARAAFLRAPVTAVIALYLIAFVPLPKEGFFINDNGLKFIQLQALARADGFDPAIPWPGRALDPELRFAPLRTPFAHVVGGELQVSYAPFFAALCLLPYRALGFAGLYLWPLLGAWLVLGCTARLAERVCGDPQRVARTRALAVAGVGLATPLAFYALAFWEHTLAVGLGLAALLAGLRYREAPGALGALGVGALAAAAVPLRPDAYLFAAVLGGAVFLRRPRRLDHALAAAAGLLMVLVPFWLFQLHTAGHPLGSHVLAQGWDQLELSGYLGERASTASRLLLNTHADPARSALIAAPFLVAAVLGARVSVAAVPMALAAGAVAFHGHLASDRPMLWLAHANGLFAVSPWLILGLLWRRQDAPDDAQRTRATLRTVLFVQVTAYSAFVPLVNAEGMHWGCRFLLVAYPLLAVFAAVEGARAWDNLRDRTASRIALAALFALSVAMQVYSVELLFARKRFGAELVRAVAEAPGDVVATGIWFLPHDLAARFFERPIFFVKPAERAAFAARLEEAGRPSVLWIGPESDAAGATRVSDGWLGEVRVELREIGEPSGLPGAELNREPHL